MKEITTKKPLKCVKMKMVFIFFAGFVRSIYSYSIIQAPEDPQPTFKVYWNMPTFQCESKRIPFTQIHQDFGILQNEGDKFYGGQVSILYTDKYLPGGVPQKWDMETLLNSFKSDLEKNIPDEAFEGIGIINMEPWRPVYDQNYGNYLFVKNDSYRLEREIHEGWKESWLHAEAKRNFEMSARELMEKALVTAKEMRPLARWGYYGFPLCFNMEVKNRQETCSPQTRQQNDESYWLWAESTALHPSLYSRSELSSSQLASLIKGRVAESKRVAAREATILPYLKLTYQNGGFFKKKDLETALDALKKSNASGVIIWGSSKDVDKPDKCKALLQYVNKIFGPTVAKYIKPKVTHKPDITLKANKQSKPTQNPTLVDLVINNIVNTTFSKPGVYSNEDITVVVIHKSYHSPTALAPTDNANYNCSYPTPIHINYNEIHIHNSDNIDVVNLNDLTSTSTVDSINNNKSSIVILNSTVTTVMKSHNNNAPISSSNRAGEFTEVNHTKGNYIGENSTENNYITQSSTEENYTGESYTEENHTVESYIVENHTRESSTEDNHTGESSTEENHTEESYSEEKHTGESYTENNYITQSPTEENHTGESYTEENYTEESYTEENHTEEIYTDEKRTEDSYTEENHTEESYTDEKNTEESYTEEKHKEESYTEENHTAESYIVENHTRESSTEDNHTGESSTEENHTEESYSEEKHTGESYTENNYITQSPTEENHTGESYTEENYTEESYTEENHTEESYTDEKHTEESYTEENHTEEIYTEEKTTKESFTEEKHTAESYTENNNITQSPTEENHTGESYTEENHTEESYTEEIHTEEIYTDEKRTEDSYTEENHTEESYTDEKNTEESYTEEKHKEENYTEENHTEKSYTEEKHIEKS